MVNFIKKNLLGSLKEFRNRFINPIQNGQCADSTPRDVRIMKNRSHVLHGFLAGCVQRRDYSELTQFLPPKHEYVLAVRMSSLQCKLYRHYLDHFTGANSLADGARVKAGTSLFKDFQILSRIWTHPWCLQLNYISKENKGYFEGKKQVKAAALLVNEDTIGTESGKANKMNVVAHDGKKVMACDNLSKCTSKAGDQQSIPVVEAGKTATNARPDTPSEDWYKNLLSETDAKVLAHSGKMVLLFEILRMAEELENKVLVFSQSLISLDLIEDFLEYAHQKRISSNLSPYKGTGSWIKNTDYYRLDGATNAILRKKWAAEFNDATNVRGRLFLISTRAGALGINLVAANRVIIFDASWNPCYDMQSIFRVYRFGQGKHVFVYRLLAQGTMEEKIYDRQVAKQSLSFRVVDQQQIERHFTQSDLTELYMFEPELLDDPKSKRSKKTPSLLPKDFILTHLLQSCKEHIVRYHEHESLLDHKEEEELSEAERKAAWAEYEAEGALLSNKQLNPPDLTAHYFHLSPSAMTEMTNEELMKLLNQGRTNVRRATLSLQSFRTLSLPDLVLTVRQANPQMSEAEVRIKAEIKKLSDEKELGRRQAIYQDILGKQQSLALCVQAIMTNRRQQAVQMAVTNVQPVLIDLTTNAMF